MRRQMVITVYNNKNNNFTIVHTLKNYADLNFLTKSTFKDLH